MEFFGHDKTPADLELLPITRIDPAHRTGEARLQRSCWFDYRALGPALRTYLYAHFYKLEFQRHFAVTVDERRAEDAVAFVPEDVFYSRDVTSIWNARRFADEHGLPYPFVLDFCRRRYFDRAQRVFPRPNQLYGEEVELDLLPAWQERLATQLVHAQGPYYRMPAWRADIAQAQHVAFLVAQVKKRPTPRHRLIARLLREELISAALAEMHFSPEETRAAEQYLAQFA